MSIPQVGDPAPDFTLPGMTVRAGVRTDGEYTLSAEYGRPVDWQMGMQDMATILGHWSAVLRDFAGSLRRS